MIGIILHNSKKKCLVNAINFLDFFFKSPNITNVLGFNVYFQEKMS